MRAKKPGRPYILGGENDAIGANSTGDIVLTYNISGGRFEIDAALIRYENGLEQCLVTELQSSDDGGRTIVDGAVQLCALGQRNDEAVRRPEWPLPISINKGQQLTLTIQDTTGAGIAAGRVGFTLYGRVVV